MRRKLTGVGELRLQAILQRTLKFTPSMASDSAPRVNLNMKLTLGRPTTKNKEVVVDKVAIADATGKVRSWQICLNAVPGRTPDATGQNGATVRVSGRLWHHHILIGAHSRYIIVLTFSDLCSKEKLVPSQISQASSNMTIPRRFCAEVCSTDPRLERVGATHLTSYAHHPCM
ncbi:hypothetical protein PSHT_10079 [Puccinia striiformis]|uniref:Uncharacterized protein n=2 Tax=Puccinia striiformis TaxID=27350 RepID=A0A0L0VZD2_9BASI|nr:hypothetical protein PSTG_02139 [Puccinia striiformis f. sp. tritici PST-78]POW07149.1 hypothetical protein PSHT_10079 [Puccinia striiformis]